VNNFIRENDMKLLNKDPTIKRSTWVGVSETIVIKMHGETVKLKKNNLPSNIRLNTVDLIWSILLCCINILLYKSVNKHNNIFK